MSTDLHELLGRAAGAPNASPDIELAWRRGRTLKRRRRGTQLGAAACVVVVLGGAVALVARASGDGGNDGARVAIGGSTTPYSAHEITADIPSGWHTANESLSGLGDPEEVLTAATFPLTNLEGDGAQCDNQFPLAVFDAIGDNDAVVWVLRRDKPSTGLMPPRPERFGLDSGNEWPCRVRPGMQARWIFFSDAGRDFYAGVLIGSDASPARQAEAFGILDSLRQG